MGKIQRPQPTETGVVPADEPRKLAEIEHSIQASKALRLYWENDSDIREVRNRMDLATYAEAEALVRAGLEAFEERLDQHTRVAFARHASQLEKMSSILEDEWAAGNLGAIKIHLSVQEREAKLLGLDTAKETSGPEVIIIDNRLPDERPEIVDGEIVVLPPPEDT